MPEDEFDSEEESGEEDELELCFGEDGVLHLVEKRPTLSLAFKTEDEMMNFMAKCSVLGLKSTLIIPEGTGWKLENITNQDSFLDNVNNKIEELKQLDTDVTGI